MTELESSLLVSPADVSLLVDSDSSVLEGGAELEDDELDVEMDDDELDVALEDEDELLADVDVFDDVLVTGMVVVLEDESVVPTVETSGPADSLHATPSEAQKERDNQGRERKAFLIVCVDERYLEPPPMQQFAIPRATGSEIFSARSMIDNRHGAKYETVLRGDSLARTATGEDVHNGLAVTRDVLTQTHCAVLTLTYRRRARPVTCGTAR